MLLSQLAKRFSIAWANAASSTYRASIPKDTQIGIEDGRASLTDGFPPVTFLPVGAGGTPPFGKDANGILYEITNAVRWTQAGGPAVYNATFSTEIGGYPRGAIVSSAVEPELQWLSVVDDNTTNPDTGGANWVPLFRLDYAEDTGTANSIVLDLPGLQQYPGSAGMRIFFRANASNTGATQVNVNGIGARDVVFNDGTDLTFGAVTQSGIFALAWDGAKFLLLNPGRTQGTKYRLDANATFYVNPVAGNDANDGLTSGTAWATLNHAYDWLQSNIDAAGWTITLSCAFPNNPTDYAAFVPDGGITGIFTPAQLAITGDATNQRCRIATTGAASNCIQATNGAMFTITGFTFSATGSGSGCILADSGSRVNWGGCVFAAASSYYLSVARPGSILTAIGNGTFNGNCLSVLTASEGGFNYCNGNTMTLNTIQCTEGTVQAVSLGMIFVIGVTFAGGGVSVGRRFSVSLNSVLNTAGAQATVSTNYIPGGTDGLTAKGGEFN